MSRDLYGKPPTKFNGNRGAAPRRIPVNMDPGPSGK